MKARSFWAAALFAILALAPVSCTKAQQPPRNVVIFIADGTGPATFTLAREYQATSGAGHLSFDPILTGAVRTHSSDSRVTDSAAAGTALASGVKTDNGVIGQDADGTDVPTVLEIAQDRGMATGLVSTARLTHATPASFAAHVPSRNQEYEIALQMLAREVDVMLGGGRDYFLPRGAGGTRADSRNLVEEAEARGVTALMDSSALSLAATLPVLGLFDGTHMDYELDRAGSGQPSLAYMTERALELLSGTGKGFFLMVEAGRIDHAGHDNDIAGHLGDMLAYDEAMRVALEFARRDGNTLIVATSDHETGGLSLGRRGVYEWYPDRIGRIQASIERMLDMARDLLADNGPEGYPDALIGMLASSGLELDSEDTERLRTALGGTELTASAVTSALRPFLQDVTARQGGVGWSTTGHSGVDVPLFAFGPGMDRFTGTLENDEVGRRLIEAIRAER